jgi:hypothetical protein
MHKARERGFFAALRMTTQNGGAVSGLHPTHRDGAAMDGARVGLWRRSEMRGFFAALRMTMQNGGAVSGLHPTHRDGAAMDGARERPWQRSEMGGGSSLRSE